MLVLMGGKNVNIGAQKGIRDDLIRRLGKLKSSGFIDPVYSCSGVFFWDLNVFIAHLTLTHSPLLTAFQPCYLLGPEAAHLGQGSCFLVPILVPFD